MERGRIVITKEDQEREIREARSHADVMGRLDHVIDEVQRAAKPIVEREKLAMVVVLLDPHAPPGPSLAAIGGGNLSVPDMQRALDLYCRYLRASGITDADKVPLERRRP